MAVALLRRVQIFVLTYLLTTSHLQDGVADFRCVVVLDTRIPERPDPDGCSSPPPTVVWRPTADCTRTRSDLAVAAAATWNSDIRACLLYRHSNDTSKPTCRDSLNKRPPATLHPRTCSALWYNYCIIIIHANRSCGGMVFSGVSVCAFVCSSVCFSARYLKNRCSEHHQTWVQKVKVMRHKTLPLWVFAFF